MLKGKKFNAFALEDIVSSIAQQLLCARISAAVHMHNRCCAIVHQLICGYFL